MGYAQELGLEFPSSWLCSLALKGGDRLTHLPGGDYPALAPLQGQELRELKPQLDFAHARRELCPVQYPAMVRILDQGAQAGYVSGVSRVPRVR